MLAAVGIAAFFFPVGLGMPRQLVETAIATRATWISGSVLAALLVFASLLMGARSRLHWVLLELVFMGGPAIWLIGNAVSQWQNQHLDVSAPQTREVRIDMKHIEHSSKSTHYYLDISGWPDPRVEKRLSVTAALFNEIPGTPACAHIVWHAGSLRDPWISSLAPSTCGDLER